MADDDARLQAWHRLLDDLAAEAAALRAEGGSPAAPAGAWRAPADLGPLPGALAARARRVLAAHEAAIAALGEARERARRHLDAVAAVPGSGTAGPVYLDVAG
ncbi:hypothetical protein [Actinotalea caeni]|uniref:hypothetical protein n=1 Tax=Actinotalea caeni TaxID=1348467 RepID=UPI0012E309C8|nr:hypothetical protein [Actinotalea caeni]